MHHQEFGGSYNIRMQFDSLTDCRNIFCLSSFDENKLFLFNLYNLVITSISSFYSSAMHKSDEISLCVNHAERTNAVYAH